MTLAAKTADEKNPNATKAAERSSAIETHSILPNLAKAITKGAFLLPGQITAFRNPFA